MDTHAARLQMVEQQIRTWDVSAAPLLNLLNELPRHRFVPREFADLAYADTEIPLSHGELMMRPAVEGRLLQAMEIGAQDRILEIGTGSGYLTACMACLGGEVVSVDLHADFIECAKTLLAEL
ncbi:MAG: protein-L-isoaspartate O-methyltransferase, partial [Woeseia sp.]